MKYNPFFAAVFFLFTAHVSALAQSRFVSPIGGTYGLDFILVNYVDWSTGVAYSDNHCNSKSYDGHQGTDFVIRDFAAMDSGIDVRAADNGKVIFVQDGIFDREKFSVISKKLGNYIGINHAGKIQTYYAHLRNGSILVKKGDSVVAGQKLALVGSSGNSESPHLHFELWYDSTINIDPFTGPCGNIGSYWLTEPKYDTSFAIWTSGFVNFITSLDTLKEGLKSRDTFYVTDAYISFWNLQYGLRNNDSVRVDWVNPSGVLWYSYGYKVTRDWWYYYFSSHINSPITGEAGWWTVKYYRNNILIQTRPFYFFAKPNSIVGSTVNTDNLWSVIYSENEIILHSKNVFGRFKIYNLQGVLIKEVTANGFDFKLSKSDFENGMYVVERIVEGQAFSRKKMMISY